MRVRTLFLNWGAFFGKLGREKVCALYQGVDLPSDLHGVLYISLDSEGTWKNHLVRELKAAKLRADWDKENRI